MTPPTSPRLEPESETRSRDSEPLMSKLRSLGTELSLAESRRTTALVVGVSGGADSVALIHGLHRLRSEWRLRLHVAHLDHGLRPESGDDAEFVANLARSLELPATIERLDPDHFEGKGNLESAARMARYRFLNRVARKHGRSARLHVAVGHTANDQVETLLMHLIRGSGLNGLGAMSYTTNLGQIIGTKSKTILLRPLLDVTRTEVEQFLSKNRLHWREDASNRDLRLTRNRIRHEILPAMAQINPAIVETLARNTHIWREEAERAQRADRRLTYDLQIGEEVGRFIFDLGAWLEEGKAEQSGVLRTGLIQLKGSEEALARQTIERVRQRLLDVHSLTGPHPIAAGLSWSAAPPLASIHLDSQLPFDADHPLLPAPVADPLPVEGSKPVDVGQWRLTSQQISITSLPDNWRHPFFEWQAFLDAEDAGSIELRTPRLRDSFSPLGMEGRRRALGDLFTDRKIPRWLRPRWPIITRKSDGAILWVAGIQMGHLARIRPQSQQVLHLNFEPKSERYP